MAFVEAQIQDGGAAKPLGVVYASDATDVAAPVGECEAFLALEGKIVFANLTGNIGSVPAKEVHLVRGTRYVENLGRKRILGRKSDRDQRLLHPRFGYSVDGDWMQSDELHRMWLEACWEATELSAAAEALDAVVEDEVGLMSTRTGKSISKSFSHGRRQQAEYPQVEILMAPHMDAIGEWERA